MEEENVNDFTQSPIPQGAVSLSEGILPGLFSGMSQIAQGQANLRALEEKKKREISTIASEFDPEDVWEVDQEELMRLAGDKAEEFTKAAGVPGVDLDDLQYGALAEVVRTGKKELTRATKKAEENQQGYKKILEEYNLQVGKGNNAAFDTAHMKDWLDRFKAAGSIEERNAMLNNPQDSPYVRNYNELDLAMHTKPGYARDAATGTRYIDEEDWANKILLYVEGQEGKGYYEKFKEDGETEEDFAIRMGERYANDVQFNPSIAYFKPPSTPRRSGGTSTKKVTGKTITNKIAFEGQTIDPVDVGTDYDHNLIEFKTTGKKDLVNAAGKTISGTPRGVILAKDGKKYIEVVLEDGGTSYVPANVAGNESLVLKETGAKDDAALNAMFKGNAKGKSTPSKSTSQAPAKKTAAEAMREAQGKK